MAMQARTLRASRRLAVVRVAVVLAVAFLATASAAHASPQHAAGSGNALPAQPIINLGSNPYSAAFGAGRYSPYSVKDSTAAERAVVASYVYWSILDELVKRVETARDRPEAASSERTLETLELGERLGRWSLRWREAQDHAAKSLAGRQEALSEHLGRMSALEEGRFLRGAIKSRERLDAQKVSWKPPALFAEIARFFRPVDAGRIDGIVPEIVNFERPLSPLGVGITAAQRAEIAGRVYHAILDGAVDRFVSRQRAGEASHEVAAIFDAPLAERLANWSEMWRQAEDDAETDRSMRLASARNGSARPALAGTIVARPERLTANLRSHVERMRTLETGHFLDEAIKRAGRPANKPLDLARIGEFVAASSFFRIAAESQVPGASMVMGKDMMASTMSTAARQIYDATLDHAVQRYLALLSQGAARPDARSVFDTGLAERLGEWSVRRGRIEAGAAEGLDSRFAAARSHFERMAALENGGAWHDRLAQAGLTSGAAGASSTPREFADVARYFRLEARWELELVRSR
jgi:hypothetical protein